jgi:hypothetical protein
MLAEAQHGIGRRGGLAGSNVIGGVIRNRAHSPCFDSETPGELSPVQGDVSESP